MSGVLIKGGHVNTDMHTGRKPREDWTNADTSQEGQAGGLKQTTL